MHSSGLVELEAVGAVAHRRSFRAAAAELGMSRTALSSAVAGLERRLGVQLFHRTTRSVSLTEAGEQFIAAVAPALAQIRAAMDAVHTHRATPTGTLRIDSSLGAAHPVPAPMQEGGRYGAGPASLGEGGVMDDVKAGRLVGVLADGPPWPGGLALYSPATRHAPAGLRAFVALIRERAKESRS